MSTTPHITAPARPIQNVQLAADRGASVDIQTDGITVAVTDGHGTPVSRQTYVGCDVRFRCADGSFRNEDGFEFGATVRFEAHDLGRLVVITADGLVLDV